MDQSQQKDTRIRMHFFMTRQHPSINSIMNPAKHSVVLFYVVFSKAHLFILAVNLKLCATVLLQFNVFSVTT